MSVIVCKWKKTAQRFRLWVKGKPRVFGEAHSYEEAEKALIDAIMHSVTDFDAAIPIVPEYDPPLPATPVAEKYLKPELVLVGGDETFDAGSTKSSGGFHLAKQRIGQIDSCTHKHSLA